MKAVLANLQEKTDAFIEKSRESAETVKSSDSFVEYNQKSKEVESIKDSIVT